MTSELLKFSNRHNLTDSRRWTNIKCTKTHHLSYFWTLNTKKKVWKYWQWNSILCVWGEIIWMASNFSQETIAVRRNWHTTFQVLKEKNCQCRILYPGRYSGMKKSLHCQRRKREHVARWPKLSLYCTFLIRRINTFTISI